MVKITIEQARKILEPEFSIIPDDQLQELLDQIMDLARYMCDAYMVGQLKTDPSWEKKSQEERPYNEQWHSANKLFKTMTLNERVKRHIDHVANCKCRPMPATIKKEIQKRI